VSGCTADTLRAATADEAGIGVYQEPGPRGRPLQAVQSVRGASATVVRLFSFSSPMPSSGSPRLLWHQRMYLQHRDLAALYAPYCAALCLLMSR